jgi:hypothetical protein
MIKLTDEDLLRHKDSPFVLVRMSCMICMAFPQVIVQKDNTAI